MKKTAKKIPKKLWNEFMKMNPFVAYLSPIFLSATEGKALIKLPLRKDFTQAYGFIHGGVLASLCDTISALAVYSMIPRTTHVRAVEFKINFLQPVKDTEDIIAEARVIKRGKTISVVSFSIVRKNGEEYATGLGTYFLIHNRHKLV